METVRCPDCGRLFRPDEPGSAYCPYCGRRCADDPPVPATPDHRDEPLPPDLVPVARAGDLAEAGYFQAVLEKHGIVAYIDTHHDAVRPGSGTRPVVLLVADAHADRAVELLQVASAEDADDLDEPAEADDTARATPVADDAWTWWKPLLVAGAFAVAAALLIRAITSEPAPARPGRQPTRTRSR